MIHYLNLFKLISNNTTFEMTCLGQGSYTNLLSFEVYCMETRDLKNRRVKR